MNGGLPGCTLASGLTHFHIGLIFALKSHLGKVVFIGEESVNAATPGYLGRVIKGIK
jgi:hypothetical protein